MSQIWKANIQSLPVLERGFANRKKDFVLSGAQKAAACTSIRCSVFSLSSLSPISDFTWRGKCSVFTIKNKTNKQKPLNFKKKKLFDSYIIS